MSKTSVIKKFKRLVKQDPLDVVLMPILYFTPREWDLINKELNKGGE